MCLKGVVHFLKTVAVVSIQSHMCFSEENRFNNPPAWNLCLLQGIGLCPCALHDVSGWREQMLALHMEAEVWEKLSWLACLLILLHREFLLTESFSDCCFPVSIIDYMSIMSVNMTDKKLDLLIYTGGHFDNFSFVWLI